MQTREDAIKWLTEQGYVAIARDWTVGESIGVAKRIVKIEAIDIDAFEPTLLHIYADRNGAWLLQPPFNGSNSIHCDELSDAVNRAIEILEAWDTVESLPHKERIQRLNALFRISP